jgi:hypothetical protein
VFKSGPAEILSGLKAADSYIKDADHCVDQELPNREQHCILAQYKNVFLTECFKMEVFEKMKAAMDTVLSCPLLTILNVSVFFAQQVLESNFVPDPFNHTVTSYFSFFANPPISFCCRTFGQTVADPC